MTRDNNIITSLKPMVFTEKCWWHIRSVYLFTQFYFVEFWGKCKSSWNNWLWLHTGEIIEWHALSGHLITDQPLNPFKDEPSTWPWSVSGAPNVTLGKHEASATRQDLSPLSLLSVWRPYGSSYQQMTFDVQQLWTNTERQSSSGRVDRG